MENNKLTLVNDFSFRPDKDVILRLLQCTQADQAYAEMAALFDRLIEAAGRDIHAAAVYMPAAKPAVLPLAALAGCPQVIYCLITVGDELVAQSRACFQAGRYSEGLLLDAIATAALFDCSCQLYRRIVQTAREAGLGLTPRLSPGDAGIDLSCQASLLAQIPPAYRLGITLSDGGMLTPVKSMAYLYGAAAALPLAASDHDCAGCGNAACSLRPQSQPQPPEAVTLTVVEAQSRRTIPARTSQTVMMALAAAGLRLHSPCGGRGSCGKCRVKLLRGMLKGAEGDFLACRSYPLSDCEIDIRGAQEGEYQAVTGFQKILFPIDSGFSVQRTLLSAVDRDSGVSLTRLLGRSHSQGGWSLQALRQLGGLAAANAGEGVTVPIAYHGDRAVTILPPSGRRLLGLAIDIGTTTLAFSLVDLESGTVVKAGSRLNSQRRYGADVISRIQYSGGSDGSALHAAICGDIIAYIRELDAAVRSQIVHSVISGNTAMLHFLLALPAASLGLYPFQPVTTELHRFNFAELFADAGLACLTTILPGISAFAGADVAAGLLQCGFNASDRVQVLLDIGTNGEIAVGCKDRIVCVATAAGPAFEGANLSCGTGSISGAIDSFAMRGGHIRYTTIGGADPVGICGSGALDIVAACLRENVIDTTGRFDTVRFPDASLHIVQPPQADLRFTQKDVRELQLAKAAMRAGLELALRKYGCDYQAVDAVFLAGSFGSHVNAASAVATGLLPRELAAKIKVAGNTALGGATRFLLDVSARGELDRLLAAAVYFDLAAEPEFNDLFLACMQFPEE
ncbi:MAG: ASKHA domain-containing protein [Sporomusaceae bacterium]|nr:ASKHA domain-containing protein [Sporomusaceae bacterium]